MKYLKTKRILENKFKVKGLELLGEGNEAIVFHNNEKVFKIFFPFNTSGEKLIPVPAMKQLGWKLQGLSDSIRKTANISVLPNFCIDYINDELSGLIPVVSYKYEKTRPLLSSETKLSEEDYIEHLRQHKRLKWITSDFQPKNLVVTQENNTLLSIDIGNSYYPYSEELYESMCRRAFVTHKFQHKLPKDNISKDKNKKLYKNFKIKYLSPHNDYFKFEELHKNLNTQQNNLEQQYLDFKNAIDNHKKPTIKKIEASIRKFLETTPFHNLFMLYGLSNVEESPLGGTCSDRTQLFKTKLEEEFSNELKVALHRARIQGKTTHTLLRLEFNAKTYFADVGIGLPITKLIPAHETISFESYGHSFTTKIIQDNEIVVYKKTNSTQNELFRFDIAPQEPEKVQAEVSDRFNYKDSLPYANKLRYYFFHKDTFYQIHDDDLKYNPQNCRSFKRKY